MVLQSIRIDGIPATFATSRERQWKSTLAASIPPPSLAGLEAGLSMRFLLPTVAPRGMPLDVDNLVEPVFDVLVRRAGWFGGSRRRICWWSATKEVGTPHGCILSISRDLAPPLPTAEPTYSELYIGILPTRATDPEVLAWASDVVRRKPHPSPSTCILYLGFGSTDVNIADISTGRIKSFMDCLCPFFGGRPGAPEDHRVSHLIVQKGIPDLERNGVRVIFWYDEPVRGTAAFHPSVLVDLTPRKDHAVQNPCRPATAKWIVCEGALRQKPVVDVQAELERLRPGSSVRLSEYLSDLRCENKLDVRIKGGKLICHGLLRE